MVRAEDGAAAHPQAFPHRNVLLRIDLVSDFALTDVTRPDVLVDDVVLSCEKTATLAWEDVPRVSNDAVQHVQLNRNTHDCSSTRSLNWSRASGFASASRLWIS